MERKIKEREKDAGIRKEKEGKEMKKERRK